MITRLEIDGFKTFQKFSLNFEPFQLIVGPNAVGKSNLFDALRLLSRLADNDLRTAFQGTESEVITEVMRGDAVELFTMLPQGGASTTIKLAVEMLIERQIQDSWGAKADLKHTRLRYEITIERRLDDRGLERLYVVHERLRPIYRDTDIWVKRHMKNERSRWLPPLKAGRKEDFISTTEKDGVSTISVHQDGHGGRKSSVAERVERTVLSGITNTEFPHAFAAREEMRQWRFLQLNPRSLRSPSPMIAPQSISPDGNFLPSTLARLDAFDEFALSDISRDLAALVPGVLAVEVEDDLARNRYTIWARMQDGRRFSSRVLSDGTLRLLVLVAFKNDPDYRGVLSFEEPENGVHPFRLKNMVDLLQELTTDFSNTDETQPLRQLLLNTHSPVLVSQVVKRFEETQRALPGLYFAHTVTRVDPENDGVPMRVTQVIPVSPDPQVKMELDDDNVEEVYSLEQVVSYLETADPGEAISYLQQHSVV
jgi:predicted ATPase